MKLLSITFERPDGSRYSASCNLREDLETTADITAQREGKVRSLAGQPDHRQNKIASWRVIEDGVSIYTRNILPGIRANDQPINAEPAPVEPVRDHMSESAINDRIRPVADEHQHEPAADEADDEPELPLDGQAAGELGEVEVAPPAADAEEADADTNNDGVVSLDEIEQAGAPVKTVSPRKKK